MNPINAAQKAELQLHKSLHALGMRKQIEDLMNQVHELDGKSPYSVIHEFDGGVSVYVLWSKGEPTQDEMKAVLDYEFNPDFDRLSSGPLCLDEMAGSYDALSNSSFVKSNATNDATKEERMKP